MIKKLREVEAAFQKWFVAFIEKHICSHAPEAELSGRFDPPRYKEGATAEGEVLRSIEELVKERGSLRVSLKSIAKRALGTANRSSQDRIYVVAMRKAFLEGRCARNPKFVIVSKRLAFAQAA